MGLIFEHTAKEAGLWRGWLKNGQSVELSWDKRRWGFGAGVHIHGNDDDLGNRMLCVKFWRFTAFLPLGIVPHPWQPMDGPQWSAYASGEFGLVFHWGQRRKSYCWIIFGPIPAPFTEFDWIAPCRARLERPGDYPTEAAAIAALDAEVLL